MLERKKLILASQSPRRKQLLEWAEVNFEIITKATEESFPDGLTVHEVAMHIAYNKALAVQSAGNLNRTILAADTIVVFNNTIIGKPKDSRDAKIILSKLSGIEHSVITGVAILSESHQVQFCDTTEVSFHSLTEEQIEYYVEKYQPYDKAGAYAIQEWIGVIGIKSVIGDFYNVMGLPVSRVVQVLKNQFGEDII